MPRRARLDAEGTLHHVIIRGIEKRRIFDDDTDRERFLARMGQLALRTNTTLYAWSLMPNHAHILLRSGLSGMSTFMRRLLTGYALTYNRRHQRYGHLFHNRYKSIVCDEDSYFRELVRYIHLNPLRAGLVTGTKGLDRYPWSGHAALMGIIEKPWYACEYVLSWFGPTSGSARRAYRRYVEEGILKGRRPELVGGGLVRSAGGWSAVLTLRRSGEKILADERILGGDDFVRSVLHEADTKTRHFLTASERLARMETLIEETCRKERINSHELKMGSRRGRIATVRSDLACQLVTELGIPLAEIARHLGVSTSAISKTLKRRGGSEST